MDSKKYINFREFNNDFNSSKKHLELLETKSKKRKKQLDFFLSEKRKLITETKINFLDYFSLICDSLNENNIEEIKEKLQNIYIIEFHNEEIEIEKILQSQRRILEKGIIEKNKNLVEINFIILEQLLSANKFIFVLFKTIEKFDDDHNDCDLTFVFIKIYLHYVIKIMEKNKHLFNDENIINNVHSLYNKSNYDIIIDVMQYLIDFAGNQNVKFPKIHLLTDYEKNKIIENHNCIVNIINKFKCKS